MSKMKSVLALGAALSLMLGLGSGAAAADVVDQALEGYRQAGAGEFSAERGAAMWRQESMHAGTARSCTSCHGADLTQPGKHARTGKPIDPMAPSVNAQRLTDLKEIEKWFRRNCRWTLDRECTPQEKGDFLTFLRQL